MVTTGQQRLLTMSTDVVQAYMLDDVHEYVVEDGIVLNLDSDPITIGAPGAPSYLLPWKSSHFVNSTIKVAKRVVVFRVQTGADLSSLGKGVWDWFGTHLSSFPASTRLYISPVDRVGETELCLSSFTGMPYGELGKRHFEIRLNLWYAPAGTDCGIHNEHRFLEIHTQLKGTGRVEKFSTREESTKFEEMLMPPGFTHQFSGELDGHGNPHYCWHRYIAETDCIWLAIEFHPMCSQRILE